MDDGLAQSQVYALLEDSRGFIWMGTRGGGISRFDGKEFLNYSLKDGMCNNFVYCLLEDKDKKKIWIGTNNGLSCYNGKSFENFHPGSGEFNIFSMVQDADNKIWLATYSGIWVFDPAFKKVKRFRNFSEENNLYPDAIPCIIRGKDNTLWAGSNKGITRIRRKGSSYEIKTFGRKQGLSNTSVRSLLEISGEKLWVGTYGGGIFYFDGTKFSEADRSSPIDNSIVWNLYRDRKNNIWIATLSEGICKWNPGDSTFIQITEDHGLSNNHGRALLEDSWGNMWFGTSGGGACNYSGQKFIHYSKSNRLPGNFIQSVCADGKNRIWTGIADKGIWLMDGEKTRTPDSAGILKNEKIKSIFIRHDSSVWLGTDGKGVFFLKNDTLRMIKELKGKFVRDIKADSSGSLFVAMAGGGICKITFMDSSLLNYRLKTFTSKSGLQQNRVNCLAFDKGGRLWYGTENNGFGYIQGDSLAMPDTNRNCAMNIRCMAFDAYEHLWIGTAGQGLFVVNTTRTGLPCRNIGQEEGMGSANIYLLQFDNTGKLYVGTESGLDVLSVDNQRNILEITHFGKAEGFSGIETCQNAVSMDGEGNLWFGTVNGLTRFNPGYREKNTRPPLIALEEIRLFYEPLQYTKYSSFTGNWNTFRDGIVFEHSDNHLIFRFRAINHSSPFNVKFQWKLEGIEKDWSPPGNNDPVTHSNLPPGEYILLVRACNEDKVWMKEPLRFHFTILPPFWLTWWFITICTAAGLGIIILIIRLRVAGIKRKIKQKEEQLKMQKDLLELEQKALRLQMNPHFIFNCLNSIQALISKKDEATSRYYLSKFSKLMRLILESSRQPAIPLETEISILENYLALEKFAQGDTFDYFIDTDNNADLYETPIPPMLVQPFVENAIVHGIKNISRRGVIRVDFRQAQNILDICVTDNGQGREAASGQQYQEEQKHKSAALQVSQERLDILNQGAKVRSLEIVDLKDEKGNACGTKVILRIVLQT